jgi:hypothetical protein
VEFSGGGSTLLPTDRGQFVVSTVCLPDSADPRRPKAKCFGGLSLVFTHVRFMASPVIHVLQLVQRQAGSGRGQRRLRRSTSSDADQISSKLPSPKDRSDLLATPNLSLQ